MKTATAEELDRMFDEGEDMSEYMDFDAATRINRPASKRVSVDMTEPMVAALDRMAARLGVNRQAVIKFACDRAIEEEEARARLRAS